MPALSPSRCSRVSTRPCAVVLFCRTLSSNGYNSTPLLDHLLSLRKEFERIALASLLLEADKVGDTLPPAMRGSSRNLSDLRGREV